MKRASVHRFLPECSDPDTGVAMVIIKDFDGDLAELDKIMLCAKKEFQRQTKALGLSCTFSFWGSHYDGEDGDRAVIYRFWPCSVASMPSQGGELVTLKLDEVTMLGEVATKFAFAVVKKFIAEDPQSPAEWFGKQFPEIPVGEIDEGSNPVAEEIFSLFEEKFDLRLF